MVTGGIQLARRVLFDQHARFAPGPMQRFGHRVLDAVFRLSGVVLRPAGVVDAVALVNPDGFTEIARHPAESARFVERQTVLIERRGPSYAVAPQEVPGAIILHVYAGVNGVAIERTFAHDWFGLRHERPARGFAHSGADLGTGHEVEHVFAVRALYHGRRPSTIRAIPPRHVAQVERRISLPCGQVVGHIHTERGGVPIIHTVIGAVQEISAIENGKIRVGAIPTQRISGQYRVIHAMRKAVTRHGSRFWRCL